MLDFAIMTGSSIAIANTGYGLTLPARVSPSPEANARRKWGDDVFESGYQLVPDVLLRCQKFLGLEAIDVVILMNITLHWWNHNDLPYPRPSAIANRLGVSTRTVERRIAKMQRLELLVRLPPEDKNGKMVRRYDLSGLVRKLRKYARNGWRGAKEVPSL